MPSEPRTDWESAVYDLLCDLGEMSRSDAQALIEAQEVHACDVLGQAWADGATVEQAVRLLL